MPVLVASDLTKAFGGRRVLDGVAVSVAAGTFVAVLGESGAGKSTLFRCLSRLIEPESGEISIDGALYTGLQGARLAAARRQVGVVFQQFNLVRRLSALDNVLAGRLADVPLWRVMLHQFDLAHVQQAAAALEAVGLGAQIEQRADTLSGGQQQRVAIARALAQQSRILLADEPVASLDPVTAAAILGLMKSLARSRGMAVVCALHQPQLAAQFADRIVVLKNGRLEEVSPSCPTPSVV